MKNFVCKENMERHAAKEGREISYFWLMFQFFTDKCHPADTGVGSEIRFVAAEVGDTRWTLFQLVSFTTNSSRRCPNFLNPSIISVSFGQQCSRFFTDAD